MYSMPPKVPLFATSELGASENVFKKLLKIVYIFAWLIYTKTSTIRAT